MTEIHDIGSIEFGILSADDIKNMAVCKIDSAKLNGPGSVYDERMGCVTDTNEKCVTCGKKKDCWGHFGYIELAEPLLHPMFYKMISTFLKCFCKQCHRLLITEDQLELSGIHRMKGERKFNKILEKLEKIDICSHCSAPQPKVVYKSKDMTIGLEYKTKKGEANNKVSILLTVEDIKKVFEDVKDQDVITLGFDPNRIHPRNLILTVMPVIPPCSRPYVVAEGNICDDDLTYQLIEIVKINNQISEKDISDQKLQKLVQSLKFRNSTFYNNSKGKAKHPTDSRPLKGLKERLTGKGGRIRNNLMGKRVDFSARTVIGAEPTLKLGQVGVPHDVCKILTKPEVVTPYNMSWLTELVNNGKANFLTTARVKKNEDGTESVDESAKTRFNLQYASFRKGTELLYGDIIVRGKDTLKVNKKGEVVIPEKLSPETKLIYVKDGTELLESGDKLIRNKKYVEVTYPSQKRINLKLGDVVDRHLIKGDIVLFNRQPTLHKGSMMAMEVVPMPYKTFRFNLAATTSWNADFDGDEMNVHAVQSYESEVELRRLSATPLNIITAQESKPVIGIKQDSLIAVYLMTKKNFTLTRRQFCDISMKGERADGGALWTPERIKTIQGVLKKFGKKPDVFNGKGLISLYLPEDFFYEKKNDANPEEPVVKIYQGVLVEGTFDKSIVGNAHGSIIQILNKEYGSKVTANFIDNTQFIGSAWLMVHGFSVGLEDCMITSEESVTAIKDTLTQSYMKAEGIEQTTQNPGIREIRVTGALSQAKDIGMKIAKDAMRPDNNFLVTVRSGAKGDFFNIAQITGLLGQQNLEGKRVAPMLNHGKRTLPHYPMGEMDKEREYESRGFVKNSFIHGLSPEEFFFHAMSGREGVCDTAMSTAKSGYIQRKIVKVCEDIQVQYDNTVRDASGKIYQFVYGQNGYDPTKTILVDGKPQMCDISRIANRLNTCFENKIDTTALKSREESPSISIEFVKKNKPKEVEIDEDSDIVSEEEEEEKVDEEEEKVDEEEEEEEEKEDEEEEIDIEIEEEYSEEEDFCEDCE